MRSDMIRYATIMLHAAIPLLALVLLGVARGRTAPWLLRPVRAAVLVALACASLVFLWLRAQPPSAPAPLEPFSLALMCFLVGWIILRENVATDGGEPSILSPLVRAAAAIVAGASAATLALLSRAPAASLGLLGEPFSHPTIYALGALGGVFARYALTGPTLPQVGLAACAWFSIARGLPTPDGPSLPAMLLVFLVAAGVIESARPRKRLRHA
jgi:hypothetical protein